MKKMFHSLIALFLFLFVFKCPVLADSGPKPSVTINFKGIDEPYYVTLLSSIESYGPNSTYTDEELEHHEDNELLLKFNHYEDDYHFWGVVEECSNDDKFKWGYWPPENFKILIYFPESDTFVISDVCERYAFRTYYTIEIDNYEIVDCYKSYNYFNEIFTFVCRVLLTIYLELIIAEIFDLKSKEQRKIIISTNLLTQILLNIYITYFTYIKGYSLFVFSYLWLEILIFIIEGFIYKKYLSETTNKFSSFKYSLVANLISFLGGAVFQSIFNSIINIF